MRRLAAALIAGLLLAGPAAGLSAGPVWGPELASRLAALEAEGDDEIGLYLREPGESGERFGWRHDESWYLASLIKVPVAVELLARVEAGELSLDETLMLRERDYVDGAGPTNWAEPGTPLSLGELLEPMLTESDNTATDLLIGQLGLAAVNERARALSGGGLGPITSLLAVRREAYGRLHPGARELTGMDFILLRQVEDDERRLDALAERLTVPRSALARPSLDAAFAAYYDGGLNAGRLDAFGELLAAIGEGRALGPGATARLLTRSVGRMLLVSTLLGVAAAVVGLYLSFHLDVPSGPSIVLTGASVFACVSLGSAVVARLGLRAARRPPSAGDRGGPGAVDAAPGEAATVDAGSAAAHPPRR